MAMLKAWISRSPKPPSCFDWHKDSHAIQHSFLVVGSTSHQNRVKADCILEHRPIGKRKHDIAYVGIGDKTAFSIVSFPAFDNNLEDQDAAFGVILSTIEANRSLFLGVKSSGRPRYLPTPPSFAIPRVDLTLRRVFCGVLAEKVIEDLLVLMSCLEAVS